MNAVLRSIVLLSMLVLALPKTSSGQIVISAKEVEMAPPAMPAYYSMEARIVGAEGEVYNDTLRHDLEGDAPLYWHCNGCPDGTYTVEIRVAEQVGWLDLEEKELKPELVVTHVQAHRFEIRGGVLIPVPSEATEEESPADAPKSESKGGNR